MTHNRSLLFAVTAAASLMISVPAFAQGAALKLHEGRSSAYVPYSVGITDTTREGQIHAN
jgi:hypothetical protein